MPLTWDLFDVFLVISLKLRDLDYHYLIPRVFSCFFIVP